jgi:16S rRNA (guanine966-N2)-methyltransferase
MKPRKSPVKSLQSPESGQFRIIAGQWRSRKLAFPAVSGLRPTPDRVRETLFNWLFDVRNLRCLDLFAGAGSLGLEALSRGAAHCDFIDASGEACAAIRQHCQLLTASATVKNAPLPQALETLAGTDGFDVIFIDPPYALDCINTCLDSLERLHLLKPEAFIYIENDSSHAAIAVPSTMRLYREKVQGQVRFSLFRYQQA